MGNGKYRLTGLAILPEMLHLSLHHQNWSEAAGAGPEDFVLGFQLSQEVLALSHK